MSLLSQVKTIEADDRTRKDAKTALPAIQNGFAKKDLENVLTRILALQKKKDERKKEVTTGAIGISMMNSHQKNMKNHEFIICNLKSHARGCEERVACDPGRLREEGHRECARAHGGHSVEVREAEEQSQSGDAFVFVVISSVHFIMINQGSDRSKSH